MKRKSDFKPLEFINPFDDKYFKKMVYPDWAKQDIFMKWREDNSKWLEDPKYIEVLDVDELITQWNVYPTERKCNPRTCLMIYKELAIVLRMIDAEHQDAILRPGNNIPGVIKSSRDGSYIYLDYDLDNPDAKKAARIKSYNTEEEAYWNYQVNRNNMIENRSTKALSYKLIDPEVYNKYFSDSNIISVRDISYYKNMEYEK